MTTHEKAEKFYSNFISLLLEHDFPFMIGGTYAFSAYTGITRPTKDMDIFTTTEDYPKLLQVANDSGFETELYDKEWIAKVYQDKFFIDIIFSEANGLRKVDKTWFEHARQGEILGHLVKLMPIEDMIRSKAFIQYKERYDGADVINLILKYGKTLSWQLLLERIGPYWELLLGHLVNFYFVYPLERNIIPQQVLQELVNRFQDKLRKNVRREKITQGLLISSEYEVVVSKWGYKPVK